jgi:hypothetical protein
MTEFLRIILLVFASSIVLGCETKSSQEAKNMASALDSATGRVAAARMNGAVAAARDYSVDPFKAQRDKKIYLENNRDDYNLWRERNPR